MSTERPPFEGTYYWSTDDYHHDNSVTMGDYLNGHLPDQFTVVLQDGSYAEVDDESGVRYAIHASGNGDSFNHKVSCELLSPTN